MLYMGLSIFTCLLRLSWILDIGARERDEETDFVVIVWPKCSWWELACSGDVSEGRRGGMDAHGARVSISSTGGPKYHPCSESG